MKLELKNVKISKSQSEETIAFRGVLYIDDTKAAEVSNAGHGGANRILPYGQPENLLVKQADIYCRTLPAVKSEDNITDLPMDLEFWISLEVGDIQSRKQIERDSKKSIVMGNPKDTSNYRMLKLPVDIETTLKMPNGMEYLKKAITAIKSKMLPGEQILNKNIPEELLK